MAVLIRLDIAVAGCCDGYGNCMMDDGRPAWERYFLDIAVAVARRGDCRRSQVGAVIVDPNHLILGTGYNGVRRGDSGCLAGACPRGLVGFDVLPSGAPFDDTGGRGCIATHAEMNAVANSWVDVAGCDIFITRPPCDGCFRQLRAVHIRNIRWLVRGAMAYADA